MNETQSLQPEAPEGAPKVSFDNVKLVYLLYLAGFVVGLTAVAGLIVAYLKRDGADPVSATHYEFQIRTFWIGLLMGVVGVVLSVILIGWLVILWTGIWTLVPCIKGFMLVNDGKPVPQPQTWMW